MKLVVIEWKDSFGCNDTWIQLRYVDPVVPTCFSVGWLLVDGKKFKTVVPHLADPGNPRHKQGMGEITIPTRAIVRITRIRFNSKKFPSTTPPQE